MANDIVVCNDRSRDPAMKNYFAYVFNFKSKMTKC